MTDLLALVRRSAAQSRFLVAGCLVLLAGFQLVLVGHAVSIESAQAFGRMADLLPAFLQRGAGRSALLLASFKGTVAFGYFHPVIAMLVVVFAIYVASEPARDVESGLVDLVLARAVPRHRLVTRTLLLALAAPVAATLVMRAGTWAGLRVFAPPDLDGPSSSVLVPLQIHLVAVAWCFAALALFLASGARRWSTSFGVCTLIAIVGYLLDFLALGWEPARLVAWISPFHYYPAFSLLAGTRPWYTLPVLLGATMVFTALAYWRFERRDV